MAKTKEIGFGGGKAEVREMNMRQFSKLVLSVQESAVEQILDVLEESTSLTRDQLMETFPSENGELVEAIVEVNRPFLDQAASLGLGDPKALETMLRSIFIILSLN